MSEQEPATATKEQVLAEMLTENTGRALLDSGDYYGRHWQQNAGKGVPEFEARQPARAEFNIHRDKLESMVTLDVYHWLKEKLGDYEPRLDRIFGRFAERGDNKDKPWLQIAEDFPEWLAGRLSKVVGEEVEVGGLYGEDKPMVVNTYNNEDALSQTIQYVFFTFGSGRSSESYVLLQIHGGCDVRGGYTRPRVFQADEALFDNARCSLFCDGKTTIMACPNGHRVERPSFQLVPEQVEACPTCMKPMSLVEEQHSRHYWDSENAGYSWSDHGDDVKRLDEYPLVVLDDDAERTPQQAWQKGSLVVDKRDHTAYCPECCGRLDVGIY
jgi:hypothetical protein